MVIGRRLELDTCAAMLDDAVSGRGRLLVLAGEAGIGKTSIAREVRDRARAAGVVTRWGACWDTDPSVFGAWIDALRMPGGDACVAVADQLEQGAYSVVDEVSATHARRGLFTAVSAALRSAAEQAPQLIVLEDLHWADQGSIELLRAVTAGCRRCARSWSPPADPTNALHPPWVWGVRSSISSSSDSHTTKWHGSWSRRSGVALRSRRCQRSFAHQWQPPVRH